MDDSFLSLFGVFSSKFIFRSGSKASTSPDSSSNFGGLYARINDISGGLGRGVGRIGSLQTDNIYLDCLGGDLPSKGGMAVGEGISHSSCNFLPFAF